MALMIVLVIVIVAFMAGSFNRGRFGIVFESVYGTQRFAFQAMHAFKTAAPECRSCLSGGQLRVDGENRFSHGKRERWKGQTGLAAEVHVRIEKGT